MIAKTLPQPGHNRVPPEIVDLLAVDRNPRSELAADKLTASQIASLKEIVERKITLQGPFSMAKAVTALARAEKSADVSRILGEFVADESVAANERAIAAVNLRLVPGPEAQKWLIANLRADDPAVQRQVIKSLGALGDEEALRALEEVPDPEQEAVKKQLAFAKALIAHRMGLPGDYLPFRPGVVREAGLDDKLVKLTLRPLSGRTIRSHRRRLLGTTYGIELGNRGFQLRAGKARWTVFLPQELGGGLGLLGLFDRKWIAALLARWDPRTKLAAVQYVVLTSPSRGGTEIMVVRTDGEVFYTGRATPTRGILKFDMRDVARSGTAPTNVQGRLNRDGVALDITIPFGRRQDASPGEPVVVVGT